MGEEKYRGAFFLDDPEVYVMNMKSYYYYLRFRSKGCGRKKEEAGGGVCIELQLYIGGVVKSYCRPKKEKERKKEKIESKNFPWLSRG